MAISGGSDAEVWLPWTLSKLRLSAGNCSERWASLQPWQCRNSPPLGSSEGTYLCQEHEGLVWMPTAGFHCQVSATIISPAYLAPCPSSVPLCCGAVERGVAQCAPLLHLSPMSEAPAVCEGVSNKPDPPFHPEQITSPGLETEGRRVVFIQPET